MQPVCSADDEVESLWSSSCGCLSAMLAPVNGTKQLLVSQPLALAYQVRFYDTTHHYKVAVTYITQA